MKVPDKGSPVIVEGYGEGLFVKGPHMEDEEPEMWLKLREDGEDTIISIPWDEFQAKRVYPEQQPDQWQN